MSLGGSLGGGRARPVMEESLYAHDTRLITDLKRRLSQAEADRDRFQAAAEVVRDTIPALNDALERERGQYYGIIDKLRSALLGLSRGSCFCQVSIGNPMYGGEHSAACLAAQEALKG